MFPSFVLHQRVPVAVRALSLFALLAFAIFSAAAQQPPPAQSGSSPLAAVEIVGSQRYSFDQIAPATGYT